MFEGAGVGAANQVGDDEGRAGCMLGGGSLVKGSSLKFQLSSTDIHNGCACFLFSSSLHKLFSATLVSQRWIFGFTEQEEVACVIKKTRTGQNFFLFWREGGCQVCNLRQTGTQTQTQSSVTKRSEWLSLRTRCLSVGLSKPQSWGNKNTSLFSLVHLQMLKCVIPVQVLSHAAEWWGDKLNALSPLTAHFHHCYGTVQSQVTKRLI